MICVKHQGIPLDSDSSSNLRGGGESSFPSLRPRVIYLRGTKLREVKMAVSVSRDCL